MKEAFDLAPPQWAQLRALLDEALALPPAQHEAWLQALDEARAAGLKPRLRALLSHAGDSEAARLLQTLPKVETRDFAPPSGADTALAPGTRIGAYRLLRELGAGGMASVWLAERTDLLQGRQVALKLPHGAWRRAGLAERLAREREILATLEHPHIARLYDAGVADDGQPWLALEHVAGTRIDAFCREHALPVRARLQLFVQVARAVAHAHAQLVVHRDLKPANILVTAEGQVKLLDFGVAKLLAEGAAVAGAEDTALTREAGRAYTPEYASPEQILHRPIGTGSDVYSLGVLLFELLADVRPYRLPRDSRAALEEAVTRGDLPRPSLLAPPERRHAIRGDLDAIVGRALRREPAERYATVAALADDVERHLQHHPVLARPDSAWVRLRAALRRHRVGVAAGTAVAVALLAGTALAWWQAGQARQQRDLALAERDRADREAAAARLAQRLAEGQTSMSDFLLTDSAQDVSHGQAVAQIERAVTMVRKQYRGDAMVRGDLLADAANRLRWIGEDARARELFAEAEVLLRQTGMHAGVARVLCMSARERAKAGRIDEGRQLLAQAREALAREGDPRHVFHAGCLMEEAALERLAGDNTRSLVLAEQALALERAAGRTESDMGAELLGSVARARHDLGQFAAAVAASRERLAVQERIGRDLGPNLWEAWTLLGMSLREGGLGEQALRAFGGDGASDPAGAGRPSRQRMQYALTLQAQGRDDEALRLLLAVQRELAGQGSLSERRNVAVHVAQAHLALGRLAEAGAVLAQVDADFQPLRAQRRFAARRYLVTRATWALRRGAWAEAQALLDEARVLLEAAVQPGDLAWRDWQRARAELALVQGRPAEAAAAAGQALALSERTAIEPRASLAVAQDLLLRAAARRAAGEPAAAADAGAAQAHLVRAGGAAHPLRAEAVRLARAP